MDVKSALSAIQEWWTRRNIPHRCVNVMDTTENSALGCNRTWNRWNVSQANNPLRKHAYLNIHVYWNFFHQKMKIFNQKKDILHISAQNIDCGYSLEPPRRGGSNEYPQSMFWAEIRKIMYTPVNPSFTI